MSPISNIAKLFVKNQNPDWVGAIQKKFAWSLGLFMASLMVVVAVVFEVRGWIPFAICGTCLAFMWLESALGICVGCKMYPLFVRLRLIDKPKVSPTCPGGVCEIKK